MIDLLVKENGKTREDALLAELFYVCDALGFWAKKAPTYLADERIKTHSLLLLGKKVFVRYRPHGVVGVIGPWNYPLTNSFGDCIPALMAGNSVVLKPSEITPLTNLMLADAARECGAPPDVFQVATGARRDRRGAGRPRRHDPFHRLDHDRAQGGGRGGRAADPLLPRAGRQGPDDRAARGRRRPRGQHGGPVGDVEQRPDLHRRSSACTWRSPSTTSSSRRSSRARASCARALRESRARSTWAR